jgi:hypothetical protein
MNLFEYMLIGFLVLIIIYVGLRLFSFAIFRSWFQAKNFTEKEELNVVSKKNSTEKGTIAGEGQRKPQK